MSAVNSVTSALTLLMDSVNETIKQQKSNLIEHDENWPSPCEYELDGANCWQPVKQQPAQSFDNVESGLDIKLNSQFKELFCLFYSDNIDLTHDKGELQLLQPWSQQDFERLQQNLIGHLMMKAKLKQTPTLFFALTDQEDLNIVVNNETGQVCLEYVGKEPHQVISEDLVSFLGECKLG